MAVLGLFTRHHPLRYGRKSAKTKDGILFLVPHELQEGDVACRSWGSPLPFILKSFSYGRCRLAAASDCTRRTKPALESPCLFPSIHVTHLKALISASLEARRKSNEDTEIQHQSFIAESLADGITSREWYLKGGGRGSRTKHTFCQH